MITEKDLQEAIAECEGKRKPDASTCLKLAAFYTIKDKMYPEEEKALYEPNRAYQRAYHDSGAETGEQIIDYIGVSEFSQLINGRKASDVWAIIDDLMDALTAVNPRLYNMVIQKLR